MAQWSPGTSAGSLVTPGGKGPDLPPPPKIDVGVSKGFDDQFAKRLDEMARQAKSGPSAEPGLVVDQIGHTRSLVSAGVDGQAGQRTAKLDEARRLIGEKKYEEALVPIDDVLRDTPTHAEACYLRAFCQFSLGKPEPALECLGPMARVGLDEQLKSRLVLLRAQIREKLAPLVVFETAMMSALGLAQMALARLDRLIELDPDGAIFHLLRAHTLLLQNRLADAARAATEAEPHCHGADRQALTDLVAEINRREVREKLAPAREYFRRRQYRKARSSMEALQSQLGRHSLFATFSAYLVALGGGVLSRGASPREIAPQGSLKELDELYFFLVQAEIQAAKPLIKAKEFTNAERVLETALQFAPRFPYLNFLLGVCVHESFGQLVEAKKPPAIDQALARMKRGQEFAKAAVPDKEIENAPALLAAMTAAVDMLDGVIADKALIEPFAGRFKGLMADITSGKPTPAKFVKFLTGIKTLRADADRASARARTDAGRSNLAELKTAIDDILKQISQGGR